MYKVVVSRSSKIAHLRKRPNRVLNSIKATLTGSDFDPQRNHASTFLGMDTASTIVIGGGIAGTSLVYHLARQGEKDVLLLEKNELTAGSTWHAAGLTTTFTTSINLKKIHYYSVNLYAKIAAETGQDIGMRQPGSIRTASTPEAVDGLKFQMAKAGIQQAPQMLLTPDEIKAKMPLIDSSKILMGLYTPNDGYVDPYSLTQALAKGAKNYGAKILQQCEVTSLSLKENGDWVVGTPQGEITAKRIVNAAGLWAKELGQMVGIDLPLVPLENQYIVTSTVPDIQELQENFPVFRMLEASCYLRKERDGLLFGPFEHEDQAKVLEGWHKDGVPKDFGKELFPGDLDRIMPHMEQVMDIFPVVRTAKIRTVVNGPTAYTPDNLPLVGPSCIPNMWLSTGFCSFGIIAGGGMGKFLADWIQNGEPMQDLIECDPGRFGSWTTADFARAKAKESHGMSYETHYPHEERFAGRPSARVTPMYGRQRERGASMVFHCGWETPAWFTGLEEKPEYKPSFRRTNWHSAVKREWQMVVQSAGVIDLSTFGKFFVEGEEAAPFLNRITANRVPPVGRSVVSHMLTPRGKVYAEVTITQTCKNRFLVVTGAESEIHDLRWMREIARRENWNVILENVSDTLGCLSVAGPKSREILSELHPRFKEKFPFFTAEKLNIKGMKVEALRLTFTGELGWEFYLPMEQTRKLYDAILEVGEKSGLGDFGTYALNVLRLEKGFRLWGREMNHDTSPVEAGLMGFVDMTKKDFIGKDSIENELREHIRRELVLIKLDKNTEFDPIGDESIWVGSKVVGNTTSGCFSYHLGQPLAFAYLPPFLTAPGTTVQVEIMAEKHDAEVLPRSPTVTHNEKLTQQK